MLKNYKITLDRLKDLITLIKKNIKILLIFNQIFIEEMLIKIKIKKILFFDYYTQLKEQINLIYLFLNKIQILITKVI